MLHINHNWSAILTGTAVTAALVITLPAPAQALSGQEVNDVAREITVLFQSELSGHGSGFIISRSGDTYYVLTANHVVHYEDDYQLITADQQAYAVDYEKIQRLPGVDLAIVEFESKEDYPVAQLGTAATSEGQDVFVSGWPKLGRLAEESGNETLIRQFTGGQISSFLPEAYDGYQMIYTNVTRSGMSGGPVLDSGGRVVGIHGMGDAEDPNSVLGEGASNAERTLAAKLKIGFNYAIPISTYLTLAPQAGIFLNVAVDNSPAPGGEVYQAEYEPTERDRIDDLGSVLDSINDTTNTIRNVCGLFGC